MNKNRQKSSNLCPLVWEWGQIRNKINKIYCKQGADKGYAKNQVGKENRPAYLTGNIIGGAEGISFSSRVVGKSLAEWLMFKQSLEGGGKPWGSTKALRWVHSWCSQGIARGLGWLGGVQSGKGRGGADGRCST